MSAVPFYYAVRKGEQRVVPAHADILSGVDFRSALAEDNVARQDIFAAVFFDAAALALESRPFLEVPCPFLCAICTDPFYYALMASIFITESSWRWPRLRS